MTDSAAHFYGPSVAEYTIYAFQTGKSNKGSPCWRKITSVNDEGQALAQARDLFGKTSCSRIEVHKKAPDPKTGRVLVSLVQSLDHEKKAEYLRLLLIGSAVAASVLTAIVGVALF
jgi:hypothetical protein